MNQAQGTGDVAMRHEAAARARFDRWAPQYGRDRRSRFNLRPQREALAALELQPEDRFLDIGCGTGAAVLAAAATVERAVGLDLSPAMIEQARRLSASASNTEFVVGNSAQLPFPSESLTAVLCSSSFHHYPTPAHALAEMARVLVPDGRLALADGTADHWAARVADVVLRRVDPGHVRLYRSAELVNFVAAAGFRELGLRWVLDRGYAIVIARKA